MPTYDYRCDACGHELELFQSITASPKRKCPECSKSSLERLIGAGAGILFKGDGFYETDYRSDSYKAGKKAEDSSAKDTSKSESKSSDSSSTKKAKPKKKKAD